MTGIFNLFSPNVLIGNFGYSSAPTGVTTRRSRIVKGVRGTAPPKKVISKQNSYEEVCSLNFIIFRTAIYFF